MEKKYFKSFDNESIPYLYFKSSRGDNLNNIIIIHGMVEPVARYEEFGNFLSGNGYNVYIMEIRGHGELRNGKVGDFGKRGIKAVFGDIYKLFEKLESENGINRENTVIFGHSMGSIIATKLMIDMKYKNLIISGCPLLKQSIAILALMITYFERILVFKKISIFNRNNGFDKNKESIEYYENVSSWLSRDIEEVKKYVKDEDCGYPVTPKFYSGIFRNMIYVNRKYKKISKDARTLSVYGTADKGVNIKHMNKLLSKLKKKKRKISIIANENGRHESLNEINKYVIYDEILKWLNGIMK